MANEGQCYSSHRNHSDDPANVSQCLETKRESMPAASSLVKLSRASIATLRPASTSTTEPAITIRHGDQSGLLGDCRVNEIRVGDRNNFRKSSSQPFSPGNARQKLQRAPEDSSETGIKNCTTRHHSKVRGSQPHPRWAATTTHSQDLARCQARPEIKSLVNSTRDTPTRDELQRLQQSKQVWEIAISRSPFSTYRSESRRSKQQYRRNGCNCHLREAFYRHEIERQKERQRRPASDQNPQVRKTGPVAEAR